MADVFISYKREDKARVAKIAEAIEAEGYSVWWDPEIPLGESYATSIRRELEAASTVLAIWSQQSIASEWVQEEATLGKRRGALAPARIDPVDPPVGFTMTQAADLVGWAGDRTAPEWRRLIEHVAANAKRGPTPLPKEYRAPAPAKPPRRAPWLAIGGVLVLIVALGFGFWALSRQQTGAADLQEANAALQHAQQANASAAPILGQAMTFRSPSNAFTIAALSPDGALVATGDALGAVRFYDATNALPRRAVEHAASSAITLLAWRDSATVAVASADGEVISVDSERATDAGLLSRGSAALSALLFRGQTFVRANEDGTIDLLDPAAVAFAHRLPTGASPRSLAFSPSGDRLLVGGSVGNAYLFNPLNVSAPVALPMPGTSAVFAAFAPDGRSIVATTYGHLILGPAQPWRVDIDLPSPEGNVPSTAFALSRDGRRAAIAVDGARVYVWDIPSRQVIGRIEGLRNATFLAFTPDGVRLLASTDGGEAGMYDVPYPPP